MCTLRHLLLNIPSAVNRVLFICTADCTLSTAVIDLPSSFCCVVLHSSTTDKTVILSDLILSGITLFNNLGLGITTKERAQTGVLG